MNKFEQTEQYDPQERIADLAAQMKELELEKQEAVDSLKIEPMHKKRIRKKQVMQKIELPDNVGLRELNFAKEDKGHFNLSYIDKNENEIPVSESDLISDMQWGHFYNLNHDIKSQAHRNRYNTFRKKYLAAAYDTKIRGIKNEMLLVKRLEVDHVDQQNFKIGEIYKDILDQMKHGERSEQAGFILEKMITGILTKISNDFGNEYGLEIEHASVIDDVELHIDLILKFPDKNRGVGVDKMPKKNVKGIQLTLVDVNNEKYKIKQEQIRKAKEEIKEQKEADIPTRIDDLVLIHVDMENKQISNAYNKWKKSGEIPGGPERFLKTRDVVGKLLTGLFQESSLDLNNSENKNFKNDLWDYFEGK